MRYLILLLLSSCATVPLCTTTCGIDLWELQPGWTCETLQDVENRALAAFKTNAKDARLFSCAPAAGYRLELEPQEVWTESDGAVVVGRTFCDFKFFKVGNNPLSPKRSSFTHELAHILQDCTPLGPYDSNDYYHSNWQRDGIQDSIDEVKNGYWTAP